MTAEQIKQDPVFDGWWYYTIELAPGLWTKGQNHINIRPVRTLLRGVDLRGARCVDIGAMEGMMSVLMCRKGAEHVVAADRYDCSKQIELIGRCQNLRLEYVHVAALSELREKLKAAGRFPFDFVMFSGVLYHMFDPLSGLLHARSLLREGGLMIIETAAINDASNAQFFNAEGRYYNVSYGSNYWFTSAGCLDYLCRLLRLKPIDCAYITQATGRNLGQELVRLAIVCRAEKKAVAAAGDNWMRGQDDHDDPRNHEVARNFAGLLDWNELSSDRPALEYVPRQPDKLFYRQGLEAVDVFQSMRAMGPLGTGDGELTSLRLDDTF